MRVADQIFKNILLFILVFCGSTWASAQEAVPFTPRLGGGNIEVRGDIILVGNNILNRASEANPEEANIPYNGQENNNSLHMEYIDIDGDPSTFSSSSAELNIADPDCSKVRYAGLYWAATYPNERSTDASEQFSGTTRFEDWFNIKFQVPGGTYVDLTADTAADPAGQEDDIIFDGYDPVNINNSFKDAPYICYKNVTNIVQGNTDPNGSYTVANMRATKGRRNGSSSAGWVMVVIYENPNETGKFISTFDGYAGLSGAVGVVDVDVNGFKTLPEPFPVRARIGVGALEGDRSIRNDRFRIRANSNVNFIDLSTTDNPSNNFFNSTITTNNAEVSTREPFGTNTLGLDLDIFNLSNPSNTVLANDETGATLRFTSSGDGYGAFFSSFSVEIIEPEIILEKRVEDIAGNDITGQGVNLGQTLDYILSFRNLGNDNATQYTIRDVLPINTTFISVDDSGAPGVTYVLDSANNEVTFSIPDNLLEIGDPVYNIRMRVKVAENCFDFINACSDLIQNLAFSTYRGELNSAQITDDPSVTDFDSCGFITPGATNFLLDDLASCDFTRTVQLCGDFAILDAGDGFDSYVWVLEGNDNGETNTADQVQDDGDPDGDPSTLIVTQPGTYIVDKIVADPCKGFKEVIKVERFGGTQTNPIVDYFNDSNNDADTTNDIQGEIVQCSVDGDLLPKIFLCGSNDSQLLEVNIPDAQNLSWEILDEASCDMAPDDCANKNLSCTWNQVGTGVDYTASMTGKYRLVINYTNGCFSRFYFDVFQNVLDIEYTITDIFCATDGNITITNLGNNYGYRLVDTATGNIVVPFNADNGSSFDISTNGAYRVDVVQLDASRNPIPGACIFSTPDIGIRNRDFEVEIETTPANCNILGQIKINILNVRPDYTYVLRLADGTLIDDETAQPDNSHTFNANANDPNDSNDQYIVEISTADGCTYSESVRVEATADPTVSAVTTRNIGCSSGIITLTGDGGFPNPEYNYAIWSYNGVDRYSDVSDIPGDAYQSEPEFRFGYSDGDGDGVEETYTPNEDGDYVFIIVDSNNCFSFSNEVTILDTGALTLNPSNTNIVCSGSSSATLIIGTTGGAAPFMFSIDNGTTYQTGNTFTNLPAGSYDLRVTDAAGCEVRQIYTITEPFTLSASAGITEVIECNPTDGAEVRITNAQGGTIPYEYSFDGGSTYGSSNIAFLPSGTYDLSIRDAGGCTFPLTVTVPDTITPPTFSSNVTYECDGEATITVDSDNTSDFNYTYELNSISNTPEDSNIFNNVPEGTHTVTINYTPSSSPETADLLTENFGFGPNTAISEIDPVYCYEPQDGSESACGFGFDTHIQDGEYSVTQLISNPYDAWLSPNDHTGNMDGRFLAINVGGAAGVNGIIYAKRNIEVLPNRNITISLEAFNLLKNGTMGGDPTVEIQLVDNAGAVIASTATGNIPKNNNADDWHNYTVDLNPGAETNLDIVIRTNSAVINGNDIAIDDIRAFQTPLVCAASEDITVVVEAGRDLSANVTAAKNVSCNGFSDATITFEVENFDTTAGFEYSVDGGGFILSNSTPVTTSTPISAGSHTIEIRKADETACSVTISHTITEPDPIIADGVITTSLTCNNGATITANATGGTPSYTYQLEDTAGTAIGAYDFTNNGTNTRFTNLPAGDYIIRVRDNTGVCEDTIDAPITVMPTTDPTFTATPTDCYSGGSDGEIVVDVTSVPGNGGFQFSINNGPFLAPTPASATTYTFNNLTDGSYAIDVKDSFGCAAPQQIVIINPPLKANAVLNQDLTCVADATITVHATGASGFYTYEWGNSATGPWNTSGFASNVYTTDIAGTYFFRVTDATVPTCEVITNAVEVTPIVLPVITSITPTNLNCNADDSGALDIVFDTSRGLAPFTINVTNTTTANDYGTQTSGLAAGNYTVTLTDAKGCVATETAVITEPDPIAYTANSTPIQCNSSGGSSTDNTSPGTISINGISGGTPEYTYQLTANNGIPPQTFTTTPTTRDHTFDILSFGIYQIDVVDANGCSAFTTNIISSPPNSLDIDVSTSTANCADGGTAIVTVDATVGSNDYQFAILETFSPPYSSNYVDPDVPGGDTATFSSAANGVFLQPGVEYTFVVFDNVTRCYYFEQADTPIASPSNMTATLDNVANVTCTGAADGNISFTFDNYDIGATAVNYEIFNALSNISTGDTGTTNVNPPSGPITITDFATLPPGEYYLLLSEVDGAFPGCSVFGGDFRIRESVNLLEIGLAVTRNDNCAVDAGVITATGSFGTAPYQYQFLPAGSMAPTVLTWAGSPANVFNAEGGDYDVYIRDAYDCIQVGTIFLPTDPSPEISIAVVDECVAEGSYEVLVTLDVDGIAPYALSVNGGPFQNISFNGSNQYTVSGLSSGTGQSVEVRDVNGCSELENFDIQPPLQFNANLTKLLDCQPAPANNAVITIGVSSGSGNYSYEISGPVSVGPLPLPSNPFDWDLADAAGTYTVTIFDTGTTLPYCSVSKDVVVPVPVEPVLSIDAFANVSCEGKADGTISVSVTDNGISPYTFSILSGPGATSSFPITPEASSVTNTSATFVGLEGTIAGITYTIEARGTNNCTQTLTQVITRPEAIIVPTPTVVEFGCAVGNNTDNATITINAGTTGGSGTYVRYEFVNTDTSTTVQDGTNNVFTETNFAGGNYTINVYDDNGCLGSTTASIEPFDELLSASIVVIDPISCDPVAGGENIRIDVVGSLSDSNTNLANYEFRELPNGAFQVSNLFNDLAVGSHAFQIRNVNTGCIVLVSRVVSDPNSFEIVVNKLNNVQCFGGEGQIQLSITDATYTDGFTWMVFDTNGTPADRSDDGPFISNGTWPDAGPTGPIPVPAGTYLVEVMQNDFPRCSQTQVFTITTPPSALTVAVSEESSPSCTDNQGSIFVSPSGGEGPFTILLENAATAFFETQTGVSSYIFNQLSGGDYDITVTDTLGCTILSAITLITPDNFSATIANTTLSCFDDKTASVTATIVGPRNVTPTYFYELLTYDNAGTTLVTTSASQAANNFQNLPAGFYQIRVMDDVGCEALTPITEIENPEQVKALLLRTSPLTCETGIEFQLTAGGGSGSYEYSSDGVNFTPILGNTVMLTEPVAGTYSYFVRDQIGCAAVLSNQITEDPVVEPTLTAPVVVNVACTGESTGNIFTQASGGLGDYRYSLYTDATLTTNYYAAGHFQATGRFNDLPAGQYYIEVISGDCEASISAEITEEPVGVDFEASSTDVTCDGEDDGTITITNNGGGTGMYQYAITDPNGTDLRQFTEPSITTNYVFTKLEGSSAGTVYRIIAQDSNGCFEDFTLTIYAPEPITLTTATEAVTCVNDTDGTITLTITGGSPPYMAALNSTDDTDYIPVTDGYVFTDLAAGFYEVRVRDSSCDPVPAIAAVGVGINLNATIEPIYKCTTDTPENYINIIFEDETVVEDVLYALDSMDSADLQLSPNFGSISPGAHYVTIAHSNGCVQTFDFQIQEFAPLTLVLENNEINRITATATGGRPGYVFFFNDENNGDNDTFRIFESGTYTVRIIDENGCETVQSIEVEFIDIKIPDFFTPDGDGLNERWRPLNQEAFPEILTIVFDRYGREISRITQNDAGWDGYYNTKALPSGDYWYVIKLAGENDPREFVGHFTLYR